MRTTKVFSLLLAAYVNPKVRVIILRGGTRSGKTWAVLQFLNIMASKSKKRRLISVVSETLPHLKRGAIRDMENMLQAEELYDPNAWHDTDKTYSYAKGVIEFFSATDFSRVLGPAREVLYINECINVVYEVYRQLAVRTTEKIILDYNPAWEFWVDEKLAHRDDVVIIDSTYLDNDELTPAQIAEIESNREIDPDWWAVYGEGKVGNREGLVVKKWDIVATMTQNRVKEYIVVDFGWTHSTAVYHVVLGEGGEVWIDELDYGPQRDNPGIAKVIKDAGLTDLECICDSAEPKSIKELRDLGIRRAIKTDSKDINLGIRIMNRYVKHVTARSLGIIREFRQYRYVPDPNGGYTNQPLDKDNHAIDAVRYGFLSRLSNIAAGFAVTSGKARR